MLSKAEFGSNLLCMKILSTIGFIPIDLDMNLVKICKKPSGSWTLFLWKFFYFFSLLYALYLTFRLGQSAWNPQVYFMENNFPNHVFFVCALLLTNFIGYALFHKNIDLTVAIFNELFTTRMGFHHGDHQKREENRCETASGNGELVIDEKMEDNREDLDPPTKPRGWLDHSKEELLVLTMPWTANIGTVFVGIGFLAAQPAPPLQLLYTALPPTAQNGWTFAALLLVETALFSMSIGMWTFMVSIVVLFFLKSVKDCEDISKGLRNEMDSSVSNSDLLKNCLDHLKRHEMLVKLFNLSLAHVMYSHKLANVTMSIVECLMGIRHLISNPQLGVSSAIMGLNNMMYYCIVYDRGFRIPEKMRDAKSQLMMTASQKIENGSIRELNRVVKSIQNVSIEIGGFHKLERMSTPIFVSYVVSQVASLLLTLR